MPVEPPASPWSFPPPGAARGDLVATGADLSPGTLLDAYRQGLFPMTVSGAMVYPTSETGWWSPVRRGVLPLDGLRVSRSLRQARRKFEVRVDTAFADVVEGCADPTRPGGWIDDAVAAGYAELHRLGWAHSVEAWQDDVLVGGLYGVAVGGLFAGESMFTRARDASKVALVRLVELLDDACAPYRLLDTQWQTPHLSTLGVVEIPRAEYLRRLELALTVPLPAAFGGEPLD